MIVSEPIQIWRGLDQAPPFIHHSTDYFHR